jgi:hypothetical protein
MHINHNIILRAAVVTAVALMFSACFTGVESTPKITSREVRKHDVTLSAEQQYLATVADTPPRQWQPGRTYRVTDNRISLVFEPAHDIDSLAGHDITLTGISDNRTFTGENVVVLTFADDNGHSLRFNTGITREHFDTLSHYDLPFAISRTLVDRIAAKMVGNTWYLLPSRRYNPDGERVDSLRYVPVTITAVQPSDDTSRVSVYFVDNDGATRYVLMNSDPTSRASRPIESLFAFDNPRKNYPLINDRVWDKISRSQIERGMTPDECRLALGAPTVLQRFPGTAGMIERWGYDTGIFLLFEDGILTDFRR